MSDELFAICRNSTVPGTTSKTRIQHLLKRHPRAPRSRNMLGQLPLHVACSLNASVDVLQCLLSAWPSAIQTPGYAGRLPLHEAVYMRASIDTIRYLMEAYPDALNQLDDWKGLPLHCACSANASIETIRLLVEARPEATKIQDATQRLPLHYACSRSSPNRTKHTIAKIQYLLEVYPEAARVPSTTGALPLHLLCGRKGPREAIESLVRAWPPMIQRKNTKGCLALDLWLQATLYAEDDTTVDLLVDDDDEPLHFACTHSSSLSTIQYFVQKDPQMLHKPSSRDGRLPLHCAVHQPPSVLNYLVREHPAGLCTADGQGFLPVHVAGRDNAPLDNVFDLLQRHPEAVMRK